MWNIFCFEIKRNRKPFLVWSLCQAGLLVMGYLEYTFVFRSNADVGAIMEALPARLSTLLGITSHVDFSTASGFYCLMADFAFYVLAAYAVLLGAGTLSREETDRTADFLYSRPLSRSAVLSAKAGAGAVCLAALDLLTLLVTAFTFGTSKGLAGAVLASAAGAFLMQLMYFAAGMMFTALSKRAELSGVIALVFLMATILSGKFLAMAGVESGPALCISARDYFPAERWLYGGGFGVWPWMLAALWILLFSLVTRCRYRGRDL